jgi:hypothetical protein
MRRLIPGLIIVASFFFTQSIFATLGVGVGTGKIRVDQKLKPGTIYNLPSLTVLNTGDEPSDYGVAMTYNEKQPQLKPPQDWFIFSPSKFHLDPGKVQVVTIKLNLPVRTQPGDYYGYLEAHPVKKAKAGVSTIGIAAAAKLYFTVIPGNIFEGIYYKVASLWNVYAPWPQAVSIAVVIIAVIIFFKKFFNLEINVKKTKKHTPEKK